MKKKLLLLGFVLLLVPSAPAAAQSAWTVSPAEDRVTLEIVKPAINFFDTTPLTAALYLSGSAAASSSVRVTAEMPFSHYGASLFGVSREETGDPETAIGNPYLGVVLGAPSASVEVGGRFPLATDNNGGQAGIAGDVFRQDAFYVDTATLQGLIDIWSSVEAPFRVRVRTGPSYSIATKDDSRFRRENELFALYAVQAWLRQDRLAMGVGLSGRSRLTQEGSFNDRSLVNAGITVRGDLGGASLGILLKVPLRRYADTATVVGGLSLTVPLR